MLCLCFSTQMKCWMPSPAASWMTWCHRGRRWPEGTTRRPTSLPSISQVKRCCRVSLWDGQSSVLSLESALCVVTWMPMLSLFLFVCTCNSVFVWFSPVKCSGLQTDLVIFPCWCRELLWCGICIGMFLKGSYWRISKMVNIQSCLNVKK